MHYSERLTFMVDGLWAQRKALGTNRVLYEESQTFLDDRLVWRFCSWWTRVARLTADGGVPFDVRGDAYLGQRS